MRRNVLIAGSAVYLVSHLAALRLLESPEDELFYAAPAAGGPSREEVVSLVGRAALRAVSGEGADSAAARISERLRWLPCVAESAEAGHPGRALNVASFEEVWCVCGGARLSGRGRAADDAAQTRNLLSALPRLGAAEFNYVAAPHTYGAEGAAADSFPVERAVAERCAALGVGYRVFRTSWVVGESPPLPGLPDEGFPRFLSALYGLRQEIEERLPGYFEYQALRCQAPVDASLNLIQADRAAELMLRVAARPDTSGGLYQVAAPESIPFTDLCERVGSVYDLSLLAVEDGRELNEIDRLFQARAGGLLCSLASPPEFACEQTYRLAEVAPEDAGLDERAQLTLLRAFHRGQEVERAARAESVAALPAALERKAIDRGEYELTYYAAGAGENPVVLLNALGQGLDYWYPLIDGLRRRHRVIIWEPRGTEHCPQPFRLSDQVDDLEAVLEREGAATCRLIGWCTGPKVAVDFYLRRPEAVSAMVFLNPSFRRFGGPEELDSAYEHNMEPLCRAVDRRPGMAASVMSSLRSSVAGDGRDPLEEADAERLAVDVLSAMNVGLRQHVLAPFRSEPVLVNYARQLLDFWSRDTLADAWRVRAPVLLVASEYDKVAAPAMSLEGARRFPEARLAQVRGATHYCLYDRPDLICELIERFLSDPEDPLDGYAEVAVSRGAVVPTTARLSGGEVEPLVSTTMAEGRENG